MPNEKKINFPPLPKAERYIDKEIEKKNAGPTHRDDIHLVEKASDLKKAVLEYYKESEEEMPNDIVDILEDITNNLDDPKRLQGIYEKAEEIVKDHEAEDNFHKFEAKDVKELEDLKAKLGLEGGVESKADTEEEIKEWITEFMDKNFSGEVGAKKYAEAIKKIEDFKLEMGIIKNNLESDNVSYSDTLDLQRNYKKEQEDVFNELKKYIFDNFKTNLITEKGVIFDAVPKEIEKNLEKMYQENIPEEPTEEEWEEKLNNSLKKDLDKDRKDALDGLNLEDSLDYLEDLYNQIKEEKNPERVKNLNERYFKTKDKLEENIEDRINKGEIMPLNPYVLKLEKLEERYDKQREKIVEKLKEEEIEDAKKYYFDNIKDLNTVEDFMNFYYDSLEKVNKGFDKIQDDFKYHISKEKRAEMQDDLRDFFDKAIIENIERDDGLSDKEKKKAVDRLKNASMLKKVDEALGIDSGKALTGLNKLKTKAAKILLGFGVAGGALYGLGVLGAWLAPWAIIAKMTTSAYTEAKRAESAKL